MSAKPTARQIREALVAKIEAKAPAPPTKEAQVAEVMLLAHEYAICNGEELISRKVKGPEAKALVHATQGAIAALDAAVRKLAGLPANSETAARAETE